MRSYIFFAFILSFLVSSLAASSSGRRDAKRRAPDYRGADLEEQSSLGENDTDSESDSDVAVSVKKTRKDKASDAEESSSSEEEEGSEEEEDSEEEEGSEEEEQPVTEVEKQAARIVIIERMHRDLFGPEAERMNPSVRRLVGPLLFSDNYGAAHRERAREQFRLLLWGRLVELPARGRRAQVQRLRQEPISADLLRGHLASMLLTVPVTYHQTLSFAHVWKALYGYERNPAREQPTVASLPHPETVRDGFYLDAQHWGEAGKLIANADAATGKRLVSLKTPGRYHPNYRQAYVNDRGSLSSHIGGLIFLTSLNLQWAGLEGEIPTEIGQLSQLRGLNLDGNHLRGRIPTQIGNLRNLQLLYLQDNRLEGPIPSEIGLLTKLENLYLACTDPQGLGIPQLEGPMPSEIYNIKSLGRLVLGNTGIVWLVPDNLLQRLPHLNMLEVDASLGVQVTEAFYHTIRPRIFMRIGGFRYAGPVWM